MQYQASRARFPQFIQELKGLVGSTRAWDVSAVLIRKQRSPGHGFSGTHRYRNNVILSEGYNQILEQLLRAHAKYKASTLERLNDFPGVSHTEI